MSHHSSRYLLLPLLALCMSFAASAPARAESSVSGSVQINFGTQPHWVGIHDTHVLEIRAAERPDYDVYRYGGVYYAYENDRWYSSRTGHGRFIVIDERAVPREFYKIPRGHWHHYPSAWTSRDAHNNNGRGNGKDNQSDHGHESGHDNGHDHK